MAAPKLIYLHAPDIGFFASTEILEEISISASANYSSQDIMNRSAPVQNYESSSAEQVSFSFGLYATKTADELIDPINAFRALKYPISPGRLPPPVCRLTYPANGSIYNDWECLCNDISISLTGPYDPNGSPMVGNVGVSLTELSRDNKAARSIGGPLIIPTTFGGI